MGHYFGFPDGYHVEIRDGFDDVVYDHPVSAAELATVVELYSKERSTDVQ